MDQIDHLVKITDQVGFPIALVLLMVILAPRYALRMLEIFRGIMEDFAEKLLGGIRQAVERHEGVINRAEAITSRQEAAVTRLEAMGRLWRNGDDANGQ